MSGTLIDLTVRNLNVSGSFTPPAGTISNQHIASGAGIATSKLVHRHAVNYQQEDGSAIADATVPIFIARGTTGSVVGISVAILTAAAGNSTVTVDLQKSTGGGAFASVLTAAIEIDSSTVVRTAAAGTIDTASFVAGDVFQVVVDATVDTGTLPQGLIVTVNLDEDAA